MTTPQAYQNNDFRLTILNKLMLEHHTTYMTWIHNSKASINMASRMDEKSEIMPHYHTGCTMMRHNSTSHYILQYGLQLVNFVRTNIRITVVTSKHYDVNWGGMIGYTYPVWFGSILAVVVGDDTTKCSC